MEIDDKITDSVEKQVEEALQRFSNTTQSVSTSTIEVVRPSTSVRTVTPSTSAQTDTPSTHSVEVVTTSPPTSSQSQSGVPDSLPFLFNCGCKFGNGQPCIRVLDPEAVLSMRSDTEQLTHDELDMVILGQLAASRRDSNRASYNFAGQRICRTTFLYLHNISLKRLKALNTHLAANGLTPRVHGNKKRLPHNVTSFDTVPDIVCFLLHLVQEQGLVLPGRVPGYYRSDIQLLPSSMSKLAVWSKYSESCEGERKPVSRKTFSSLWQQLVPQVVIMTPMTDLCWQCQKNSSLIQRAANRSDEDKSQVVQKALAHVQRAQQEREAYNAITAECRVVVRGMFLQDGAFSPPSPYCYIPPLTGPSMAHYSFDYAQQVHYPDDPLQPGPIYFLTPRKCVMFGLHCEAIPRQVTYLCDEAVDTGKGSNSVVSQLHHYFQVHGLGETNAYLHADNCAGQNKNNIVLRYLLWRVMTGQHKSITFSFLLTGHTKFAPDWCFGLIKRLYRRTKVSCLDDIVKVVEASATCNVAQLVGDQQGNVLVKTYNWLDFFDAHFR